MTKSTKAFTVRRRTAAAEKTLHYILGNNTLTVNFSSETVETKRKWNVFTKIALTQNSISSETTLPKQRQEKTVSDQ